MVELHVKLNTDEEINRFVFINNSIHYDTDLVCGKKVVDAKSMLGILSLDLSNVLTLLINADRREESWLKKLYEPLYQGKDFLIRA
ncbi:MAG: HPr family phosphocarrier protein [Lachnospiraceae bacterium]